MNNDTVYIARIYLINIWVCIYAHRIKNNNIYGKIYIQRGENNKMMQGKVHQDKAQPPTQLTG